MSISSHPSPARHRAYRDLLRSWLAVAVMLLMLGLMPVVGSGWEPTFAVSALGLVGFLVVLLTLAVVAIRSGTEARREGSETGILPAAIGGAIGGLFALLVLGVLVLHLLGFE